MRRIAAPAGRWLYLGTNCVARRRTASAVKVRPGREDADFFMRAFDDTGEKTTPSEALWGRDASATAKRSVTTIVAWICKKR